MTAVMKAVSTLHRCLLLLLLLSLAPQPSLGLGLLKKIRLNFLEASQQFSFLQGMVVSLTPNPHLGGPGLCIYIPQRQGAPVIPLGTHFSRLLRHAWVTVGLFLFPVHHTGNIAVSFKHLGQLTLFLVISYSIK
jgi:hypothetical protein